MGRTESCKGRMKYFTLAAALLLVAAFAFSAQARGPWGGSRPEPGERLAVLAKVMDLSPEQEAKVKAVLEEDLKKAQELREKYRPSREAFRDEMQKLRDQSRASIEALLNDSQREKFRAVADLRERRGFSGQEWGPGEGPCGGPGGEGSGGGFGRCREW